MIKQVTTSTLSEAKRQIEMYVTILKVKSTIVSYAPQLMQKLRNFDGITEKEIIKSLMT